MGTNYFRGWGRGGRWERGLVIKPILSDADLWKSVQKVGSLQYILRNGLFFPFSRK
jgi:hypothetical protein